MPANYVLLEKITVGAAGASSVTFSGIPQTGYTDLVVKVSARDATGTSAVYSVRPNGSSANLSDRRLTGTGSSASSSTSSDILPVLSISTDTSNTFGNSEIYIPNYTSANYKSISADSVTETMQLMHMLV